MGARFSVNRSPAGQYPVGALQSYVDARLDVSWQRPLRLRETELPEFSSTWTAVRSRAPDDMLETSIHGDLARPTC